MSGELIRTTLLDIENLFGDDGLTFEERRRLILKKTGCLPSRFGRRVEDFALAYLRQQKIILSTLERIHRLLVDRGEIDLDIETEQADAMERYRRRVSEAYGRFLFLLSVRREPRGTVLVEWAEGYLLLRFYSSIDFHLFYLVEPRRREIPVNSYTTTLPIEFGSERRELPIIAVVHNLTVDAFNQPIEKLITGERRRMLERFFEEEEILAEYRQLFASPVIS